MKTFYESIKDLVIEEVERRSENIIKALEEERKARQEALTFIEDLENELLEWKQENKTLQETIEELEEEKERLEEIEEEKDNLQNVIDEIRDEIQEALEKLNNIEGLTYL